MKVYSEYELNVPALWFTGEEWTNGFAQRTLQEQYRRAVEAHDGATEWEDDSE